MTLAQNPCVEGSRTGLDNNASRNDWEQKEREHHQRPYGIDERCYTEIVVLNVTLSTKLDGRLFAMRKYMKVNIVCLCGGQKKNGPPPSERLRGSAQG